MTKADVPDWLQELRVKSTIQSTVFRVLEDQKWHCRECGYHGVKSGQLAGGGGIQGLERGTGSRPGLVIESESRECHSCKRRVVHDRWTGETKQANPTAQISIGLVVRILAHFNHTDAIEQRKRAPHELIIDHRFPMERWGAIEEKNDPGMGATDIDRKFQLLKKDISGNHNLLKSRACEVCIKTGTRGAPLGINFHYEGTDVWPAGVPPKGPAAERGCVGCGWYDFGKWRVALNARLRSKR